MPVRIGGGGRRFVPAQAGGGGGAVTHGDQLTLNSVGPWALQGVSKGSESLTFLDPAGERISSYPGWGRPSWIPGTDYAYNNNPSNLGGVVPAGGMTIDGYSIPAGTWVVQFREFNNAGVIITGDSGGAGSAWPGVLFRGCRMRQNWGSPGFVNYNAESSGGISWFLFCDAGGIGYVPPNVCEGIIESQGVSPDRDKQYIIRCNLGITSNLAGGRNNGDAFIENYCRDVPRYYNDDTYHIGGLMNSGGQTATLWLRNNIDLSPQPGYPTNTLFKAQVSCVQMAADVFGYPGTGTNRDGSQGYQIRDNYIGGSDYSLQLGLDKANTSADVSRVVVTGNKFTTKWFEQSGRLGISYKNPTWGVQNNVWSSNTWADDYGTGEWDPVNGVTLRQYPAGNGPRVGATIDPPTII